LPFLTLSKSDAHTKSKQEQQTLKIGKIRK